MRGHPPANGYWNGNPYTVVAMFASRPAEALDFVKETGTTAASADVPTSRGLDTIGSRRMLTDGKLATCWLADVG